MGNSLSVILLAFAGAFSAWAQPSGCQALQPIQLPFIEDFEQSSGTLTDSSVFACQSGAFWQATPQTSRSRVRYGTAFPGLPDAGLGALALDVNSAGSPSLSQAVLTLNLSAYQNDTNLIFSFRFFDQGDEPNAQDQVEIRGSATQPWIPLVALTNGVSSWQTMGPYDLDSIVQANGQSVGAGFQVRFSQFDNFSWPSDGLGFDQVVIAQSSCLPGVPDVVPPTVRAQNAEVFLNANGQATLNPQVVDNGSFDNCSLSLSVRPNQFNCSQRGANLVWLVGTDPQGNRDSAQAIVLVRDTIAPQAQVRSLTLLLNAQGQAFLNPAQLDSNSSDNCGPLSFSVSRQNFSCADIGPQTVLFSATDAAGNSDTISAILTVADAQAPHLNVVNSVLFLDSAGQALISPSDLLLASSDNCAIDSLWLSDTLLTCAGGMGQLVQVYAQDGQQNLAQGSAGVTLLDTIRPWLSNVPANQVAYAAAGSCGATVSFNLPTVHDNCSGATLTASRPSASFFSVGAHTITFTATDAQNNLRIDSFTVSVLDTVRPIFTANASAISQTPLSNQCGAVVQWNPPLAIDNCGTVSLSSSHESGDTLPVGTTQITYTATDSATNQSTYSFSVTVADQLPPQITNIPSTITVAASAGSCSAVANYALPTVVDNCSGATLTTTHPTGSTFPVGRTRVTFTATDAANNVATASFNVRVLDQEDPVVTQVPPSDTVGLCRAAYFFSLPQGSDNCGAVQVTQTAGQPSGTVLPVGTTVNVFTLQDASGNTVQTQFSVTVLPAQFPVLPQQLSYCENDSPQDFRQGQNLNLQGPGMQNGAFDPAQAGPGQHFISYIFTDTTGCSQQGRFAVQVSAAPNRPQVQQLGSTVLGTGLFAQYQWYRNGQPIPGATQQTYQYSQGGNYQVRVQNANACSAYSADFVVGQSGGGIGLEEALLQDLQLFPNPAYRQLFITGLPKKQDYIICLVSTTGQKMHQWQIKASGERERLPLPSLSAGSYLLTIQGARARVVRKIQLRP